MRRLPSGCSNRPNDSSTAERDDQEQLRGTAARVGPARDETLWPLLVELVEIDTEKHITILEYLRVRLRAAGERLIMEYRTLGRTGISVSTYCLGTMMFGAWGNPDADECIAMVDAAFDAGMNFVDTADVYDFGGPEEILGRGTERSSRRCRARHEVPQRRWARARNLRGNSRRWIMRAVEDSLRRLGTDWIDLYQVHRPDPTTDIDETLAALSDLVHAGKVRAIGTSTFPAEQLVEAQWVAERRGHERFATEQPPYSVLARGVEAAVLPTCQRYGIGVLVWAPLNGGWLTR